MSLADNMLNRWRDQLEPIEDLDTFAREINPQVRIEGFLHTERKTFIFPDGSKALYANSCLKRI